MLLGGMVLFPHTTMPLYIFEPRYREMLERVLEGNRMFGVAAQRSLQEGDVHEVAGVGLVRACVRNPDGTSHLVLQGMARVRLLEWTQEAPYRVARVKMLHSVVGTDENASRVMLETLREIIRRIREKRTGWPEGFEKFVERVNDPDVLCDVVASGLVTDPFSRQALLEELNLAERVRKLIACLRTQFPEINE